MPQPINILQQYWKHHAFRPLQEEIIQSVLTGNDTLALLPTGGGKSICFQVPALLMDGLCLVISPLIALMLDQVDSLKQKGISAAALHSGLTTVEVKEILLNAADGRYKFLYCSPERLESKLFAAYLPVLPIRLLVIDEAHCISQWGYDFRPPYLRIAATRKQLPRVTMIALTASATPMVQQDIIEKLNLQSTAVFRQSFERPNISYSNFLVDSKINKIIRILQKVDGSSIVYCNNRKQTKKIAEALLLQGISADFYHAGLPQELREIKQQNWIQHKCRVMVCTNAFGMGIDKADVRTVIHHDSPDCIENYYQEAGRAGRDGKRAFAVLLYQQKDLTELINNVDKKFPPIPIIKEVYQAIADYLQIPVGNGEGIYYDIDFTAFVQNFKLDPLLVMNTLRVLEQEGHIQFADHIFLPTQVSFTATKEAIYLFEENFPLLESLIKALLRTYEGIIDNRVSVFEQTLAKICRITTDEITLQLKQLQQHGIIEYLPKKETPQIHFLVNRAPAAHLHIQQDAYLQRKKLYEQRVQTMVHYAIELTTCRSRFIANYFGDNHANNCGVCDNCLAAKRKTLTEQEFATIEMSLQKMGKVNIPLDAFFLSINTISKEKIWTVLNCLQSEDKIFISDTKKISWLPKAKLSSTASGSSPTA